MSQIQFPPITDKVRFPLLFTGGEHPAGGEGEKLYSAALQAGDQNKWTLLMRVWANRFEQFPDSLQ